MTVDGEAGLAVFESGLRAFGYGLLGLFVLTFVVAIGFTYGLLTRTEWGQFETRLEKHTYLGVDCYSARVLRRRIAPSSIVIMEKTRWLVIELIAATAKLIAVQFLGSIIAVVWHVYWI